MRPAPSTTPPASSRAGGGSADDDARERALRRQRQNRALQLLREALEALPEGRRDAFWERNVARDAALNGVRALPEFLRLSEEYAKSDVPTGASD